MEAGHMNDTRRASHHRPGRLEVWYDTFTDHATGTGFWLHHETVAPSNGDPPYAHGWVAVFPPAEEPVLHRFGPTAVTTSSGVEFCCGDVVSTRGRRRGTAGPVTWDLTHTVATSPLFTFGRAAWERQFLPAVHYVPHPTETFAGAVSVGERTWTLSDAPGGVARIRGHGNAERWGWLHADLGGGDVLEVVAAVSRRPGLNRLRPLPAVQLRVAGVDWPGNPLLAAPRFRADLSLPEWTITGRVGNRRLRVRVVQSPQSSVVVPYRDPDGATATCTNCEIADAEVVLERGGRGNWSVERSWTLSGTAHAEIGRRP
jgi:hypothetical protein